MPVFPPMSRIALALLKVDAVQRVQHLVQYRFQDKELPWQAVQAHRSGRFPHGNLHLAYIGDAVLKFALTVDGEEQGLTVGKYEVYALRDQLRRLKFSKRNQVGEYIYCFPMHSLAQKDAIKTWPASSI